MNAQTESLLQRSVEDTDHELAPEIALMVIRFRLRARRRVTWLRHIWTADADLLDSDSPTAECNWFSDSPGTDVLNAELAAAEAALKLHSRSRLFLLQTLFGLSDWEFDLLQACAAVSFDPALARVCAMLHGDLSRPFVTADIASRLYEHGRCAQSNPESPLARWLIVRSHDTGAGLPQALILDSGIREWLRGANNLDEALTDVARLQRALKPLASWPVEQTVVWLKAQLKRGPPNPMRICVLGRPESGRRTFAAAVCSSLGFPLLAIRADDIDDDEWRKVFIRAQRHGFLHSCALAWSGASLAHRRWPRHVLRFPLQFVIAENRADIPAASGADLFVELPASKVEDRRAVWKLAAPTDWQDEGLDHLAQRYRVEVGHIARACESAPANPAEASHKVREFSRASLGGLAQLLPCTFTWDDLVLARASREVLQDLLFEARARNEWWESHEAQRLFPQGRGLLALFNGPPGTGKTMAAQVIAGELGYDLLRIDLSAVVSKYVGETSQNLDRILSRAAHMDAVLLFDEADGLFGQRATEVKEAQDKFANTDSAFLLQAIEAYPGIAILASNQKGCIDTAFLRRIRFVVEFSKPDAQQRLEIWRRVTEALAGCDRADSLAAGLDRLAVNVESTGAQIKNAVLNATFMARRADAELDISHLLAGLERELAKDSRFLSAKERARMTCDD